MAGRIRPVPRDDGRSDVSGASSRTLASHVLRIQIEDCTSEAAFSRSQTETFIRETGTSTCPKRTGTKTASFGAIVRARGSIT